LRRLAAIALGGVWLAACATLTKPPPPPAPAQPWELRLEALQRASDWDLSARAAVAIATQGWQASLDWHQRDQVSELHLAGPLGVGASVLRLSPAGLALDGAPPGADVQRQLIERLGFEPPLNDMRYWLLGVPAPGEPFELIKDAHDRAQQLQQGGWTIDIDRYLPVKGDLLPAHLTLTHENIRVRVVADRWNLIR
jgi:outer membrane lipoprotein LolB